MDIEWWEFKSDLAKDIHDTLKKKENEMIRLKGMSKLMYWRRYLVDWLALTCQKYKLNSNAQHLAVCLYDRFTDQFQIAVEDLQMLVLCCLLISSKFEEREEKIPKFKTLMDHLQWKLDANDYLQMEIRLLSAFEWHIGFPTASHFKEYYMQAALGLRDLHAGQPITNSCKKQTLIYLEKNVNYFLEVSLQDQAFLVFKPSLITAACVAASRICLQISPTWTIELHQITLFSWNHLAPCIEILLRLHDDDRKAMHHHSLTSSLTGASSEATSTSSEMDSTGGTPVQSPVNTVTSTNSLSSEKCSSSFVPVTLSSYHYNRGYLI